MVCGISTNSHLTGTKASWEFTPN